MRVLKRDNKSVVPFDEAQIRKALLLGFGAVGNTLPDLRPIVQNVMRMIHGMFKETVSVDDVLNCMEATLMQSGYHDVAKAFILYRQKQTDTRNSRLVPDATALKDYIHVAKYAKWRPEWSRREVHGETVDRLEAMHVGRFPQYEAEIRQAFKPVRKREVTPSSRSLQFGGDAIAKHNARLYNCCFTHIDRTDVFSKVFYLLLCGCGVGYSVQWRHVDRLPRLKTIDPKNVRHWTIKDSIEGWSDAIEVLLSSFFMTGEWVEFAYHEIRREGAVLKTSGGRAPGHLPLKRAIEAIRGILLAAQGRKLRPIECHDILCYLSIAVLSGGIRRSAMISLFSPEDTEMLYAKAKGVYDPSKDLNAQRQMANNSAVFLRSAAKREVFYRVIRVADENYGDPGFLFVEDLDHGTNPCGEIGLWPVLWSECPNCDGIGGSIYTVTGVCEDCFGSGEIARSGFAFCNLTSINCSLFKNENDFYHAAISAAIIGTLQATYTSFPYLGRTSELIAQRDALLGVSLNGMMDCPSIALNTEFQQRAARVVVEVNAVWAKKLGIRPARSGTTVKPEGTNSLALGCIASGHGTHHATRYLRRITGNVNEPPVQEFMRVNPHMVEQKPDGDVALVFPVQARDGAICIDDVTALDFVASVMATYENWVVPGGSGPLTHSVSCTVTLKEGERDKVVEFIWNNRHRIAAMSFAPHVLDKLYAFAPREAITTPEDETYWNRLIAGYRPVDWSSFTETHDNTDRQQAAACVGPGDCDV